MNLAVSNVKVKTMRPVNQNLALRLPSSVVYSRRLSVCADHISTTRPNTNTLLGMPGERLGAWPALTRIQAKNSPHKPRLIAPEDCKSQTVILQYRT